LTRFVYPIVLAYGLSALMLAPLVIAAAFAFGVNVSRDTVARAVSWGALFFIVYGFVKAAA